MSLQTVSNYIVNKIKAVPDINPDAVYDYEDPTFAKYPAISVTVKEWSQTWLTNQQNETRYIYTIRVYQEINKNNIGVKQVEDNLRSITDTLIAAFNADNKLGATVVFSKPIGGRTGYIQNEPIRTYEFDLEVHDVITSIG